MNSRRGMSSNKIPEKARNTKYVLKRLWDYLYHFKGPLFIAFLLTISANLFSLIGPILSGNAIDVIDLGEGQVDFQKITLYAVLMIVFYVLSSVFSFILSRLMTKIGKQIVYKMRTDAFDKLSELPISYFDSNQIGDIISKFSYDMDTVNTSLSSDLISLCTSFITVIGSLIMMLIVSPILVLVFVVTIPISLLFTKIMLKRTKKLYRARSAKLGELNGYIEEMVTGNKTIKAYGVESKILDIFDYYNEEATESSYRAEYYGSVTGPGVNFVNNLSLSLICVFGSILNIVSDLSVGKISSFVLYSRKFSGPINEAANIFTDLQSALAASERVFGLIDATPEIADVKDAIVIDEIEGNVELQNVSFGYLPDRTIIHDLSFNAKKGQVIAIVGPTGGGKTTIVNLLMRFYDIDKGKISVDDISIDEITRSSLRKSYAMVLQDTWLFEGTIFENLAYGDVEATMDDVVEAAKMARIDSFIRHLPNGYNTVLNEGGVSISKGQKQLLTIARAMLLKSHMLILDEATSNVDTRTEIQIQAAMKLLMKDKTCFIIAHRLSTIQNADLILVVKDGDIVEMGNHQELLNKKGFYNELYLSQFN